MNQRTAAWMMAGASVPLIVAGNYLRDSEYGKQLVGFQFAGLIRFCGSILFAIAAWQWWQSRSKHAGFEVKTTTGTTPVPEKQKLERD